MSLFLLLALTGPPQGTTLDRVDLIEVNHVLDEYALPVFDQLIFWRWHAHEGCYHVHAWRLMRDARTCEDIKHRQAWEANIDQMRRNCNWTLGIRTYRGKFIGGPMMPEYSHVRRRWEVRWEEKGIDRLVTAPHFSETWTQYDRERRDQKVFDEAWRVGLR